MAARLYAVVSGAILLLGLGFLLTIDLEERLDTDVASLLPRDESPNARVLRSLISDKQGRLVYLAVEVPRASAEKRGEIEQAVVERLRQSAIVTRASSIHEQQGGAAYAYLAEQKLALLFPKWLARKRTGFNEENTGGVRFEEWAARETVADFESFLESPVAMELASPEFLDPLLLTVDALERLMASEDGAEEDDSDDGTILAWAELSASPLLPETQSFFADLVNNVASDARSLYPEANVQYGGLVRLAGASRERIRSDIAKINLLSLAAVALVSILLIRPPWKLLLALPVVIVALVGAAAGALLVFPTVNIIVLIIGSILIGTAIDYAFHTLFAKPPASGFPTRKLLVFACLSTLVGFGILLFSDMTLIRQIGVFVAGGLVCAFLASQALPAFVSARPAPQFLDKIGLSRPLAVAILAGVGLLLLGRLLSVQEISWQDDIRNLEAPDPTVVAEDLRLRGQFGFQSDRQLALSVGESFAEALESQSQLLEAMGDEAQVAESLVPSDFLPTKGDIDLLEREQQELEALFDAIEREFVANGYGGEGFEAFFVEARAFASRIEKNPSEEALLGFSERLEGPLAAMLNSNGDRFWTALSLDISPELLSAGLAQAPGSFALSQLTMLNENLNTLRERLMWFGLLAMGAVALTIIIAFGFKHGLLVVGIPLVAVSLSVTVASFSDGPLNLFNLIGCFLGGAIALDYALFGIEALRRSEGIPYSVWLSAATTGASFLVLTSSYIAAVRSLGMTVSIITLATLLLLLAVNGLGRPHRKGVAP